MKLGQVHIRTRKLKDGRKSIYLDIYAGGVRRYEYLRLYLKPETTLQAKNINAETLRIAETLRARRALDLQASAAGVKRPSQEDVSALIWAFVDLHKDRSEGTFELWQGWGRKIGRWPGTKAKASDISPVWWACYTDWVKGSGLGETTQYFYLQRMRSFLRWAEETEKIARNPAKGFRQKAIRTPERVWLTLDQVRKLKAVTIGNKDYERAFLFGCVAGLRLSDITALDWADIQDGRVVFRQKKTGKVQYLDLSRQALALLGERGVGKVFNLDTSRATLTRYLNKWAKAAGLDLHISFHTSRHTFAVLALESGVDIYTLSKLLGHSSITTTQVYADIADARRKAAMDMLPEL